MAINKFKRSRLTFELRSLILESHQYIKTVFSQTIGPFDLTFHVKTPYDKLVKINAKNFGHMTKMAATLIYVKPFKCLLLWNQKSNGLETWYVALGMWALQEFHK